MGAAIAARQAEHDAKRRRIIEAAAEVFYERGFVAGTTKEVAAKVVLSQPAIYHYFGSKDVLLQEIARRVDRDMMQVLERGRARATSARVQLIAIIHEFTAAAAQDRELFAVYYKELHVLPEDIRSQIARHEGEFVAGVAGVVGKLQAEGSLPAQQPTTALTEAILGMVSWLHRWYRPSGQLDVDAMAGLFTALIRLERCVQVCIRSIASSLSTSSRKAIRCGQPSRT
jgi:AcrR family transcriptional regulator